MAGFLNNSQIATLTGTFLRHFQQFSEEINNYVTIFKEAIQTINNPNSQTIYGYGSDTTVNQPSDISYTEVSRQFPAVIIYGKDLKGLSFPQVKTDIINTDMFIKVDNDAKNYIINGKNERVLINQQTYDITTNFLVQNFFGLRFYYFKCTERQ